jgi:uncharacterized protein (DUF2147 family)
MKRLGCLAVLMMLSSSAHAATFSFVLHGHRVRVERPPHCFSRSCLSVTLPGLHGTHEGDRVDDIAAASDVSPAKPAPALPASSPAPLPSPSSVPVPAPVQAKPAPAQPVIVAVAPSKPRVETPVVASPPPSMKPQTVELTATAVQPVPPPRTVVEKPPVTAQAASEAAAAPPKASQQAAGEPADTPLGDWQTEGNKGLVRIESCGTALCGYTVDAATNAKGEPVLINMKPKGATDWAGTIVSRASGNTYYAKMAIKQSHTLRVEACAMGRFFCSGNDWSRIVTKPQALITSQQIAAQPPS